MDRINILVQDGAITLAVCGAVDIHSVGDLRETVTDALSTPGLRRLVVDCTLICSWDRIASTVVARSQAAAARRGVIYQVIDPHRITCAEVVTDRARRLVTAA